MDIDNSVILNGEVFLPHVELAEMIDSGKIERLKRVANAGEIDLFTVKTRYWEATSILTQGASLLACFRGLSPNACWNVILKAKWAFMVKTPTRYTATAQ